MKYIFFSLLVLASFSLSSQTCPCLNKVSINICYISRTSICPDLTNENCGITFDNNIQAVGIVQKITNSNNFGLQGKVPCAIELVQMMDVPSVNSIEQSNCDIFYVGNFFKDTIAGINPTESLLSNSVLDNIYNWSIECPQNLVIVTQQEAKRWGYTVENENENPNVPFSGSNPFLSIFNGSFGVVNSFNQGGSYQGVITAGPSTGFIPLSEDQNENLTVVLDNTSNDLILGDIGLFSSEGGGEITLGPEVNNENDILACNIFGLGCEIVLGDQIEHQHFELCSGESVISPNGNILDSQGVYSDTIGTTNGCDTIINTHINLLDDYTLVDYNGCKGDGYTQVIENIQFNESNPTGSFNLINQYGCDSIVDVNLSFITEDVSLDSLFYIFKNTNSSLGLNLSGNYSISWLPKTGLSCFDCPNPQYFHEGGITNYEVTLESENGCISKHIIEVILLSEPYIPNAFSPNNDGINDQFGIFFPSIDESINLELVDFTIFDRWGNKIINAPLNELNQFTLLWDGKFNGQLLSPGVFVYRLSMLYPNGELRSYTGSLSLIN